MYIFIKKIEGGGTVLTIYTLLLIVPIILACLGICIAVKELVRLLCCRSISIIDYSCDCLQGNVDKIKSVSMKYGNRIRGSIRLSQGRIKSVEEMRGKEKNIFFP